MGYVPSTARAVALVTCKGDPSQPEVHELAEKLIGNGEDKKNHSQSYPPGFPSWVRQRVLLREMLSTFDVEKAYSLAEEVVGDSFGTA